MDQQQAISALQRPQVISTATETSAHRKLRRARANARTLVRVAKAAALLQNHHSRQRAEGSMAPLRDSYWNCTCGSWSWARKSVCAHCHRAAPAWAVKLQQQQQRSRGDVAGPDSQGF
eukprot:4516126-Amphidinium_carterae.1